MATPVGLAYKLLGAVGIMVAIYGAGYFYGWRNQHDALVSFRAAVEQTGREQTARAKQTEIENAKNTQNIADDFAAERTALFAKLDSLQHKRSGRSAVPLAAVDPSKPVGTDRERVGAREGTKFYASALDCELKLKGIREWVRVQRIPVSNGIVSRVPVESNTP